MLSVINATRYTRRLTIFKSRLLCLQFKDLCLYFVFVSPVRPLGIVELLGELNVLGIHSSLKCIHIFLCDGIRVGCGTRENGTERHAGGGSCSSSLGEGVVIFVLSDGIKHDLVLSVNVFHNLEALTKDTCVVQQKEKGS